MSNPSDSGSGPSSPIPRITKKIMSFEEFQAQIETSYNKNATKNVEMEKLVLKVIGDTRYSWTQTVYFTERDYTKIAFLVWQISGVTLNPSQVAATFKKAKTEMRRRLKFCVDKNLDATETEAKMSTWPLYSTFKYYREALVKETSPVDRKPILPTGSVQPSNGNDGSHVANPATTSTVAVPTFNNNNNNNNNPLLPPPFVIVPIHQDIYIVYRQLQDTLQNNPNQQKVIRNAITKVLVAIDDRQQDFKSANELFEKIAKW